MVWRWAYSYHHLISSPYTMKGVSVLMAGVLPVIAGKSSNAPSGFPDLPSNMNECGVRSTLSLWYFVLTFPSEDAFRNYTHRLGLITLVSSAAPIKQLGACVKVIISTFGMAYGIAVNRNVENQSTRKLQNGRTMFCAGGRHFLPLQQRLSCPNRRHWATQQLKRRVRLRTERTEPRRLLFSIMWRLKLPNLEQTI
jgi:hypothetical protein